MDYLPEWKIYLWKKLLLNQESRDKIYQLKDFLFFDTDDLRGAVLQQNNSTLHSIRTTTHTTGDPTPLQDTYCYFEPKEVLQALIELADTEPHILEIWTITFNKTYLTEYLQKRREYLVLHQKKTLSSVSMGSGRGGEPNPKYFNDIFCGLGENLYRSVKTGKNLTSEELKLLITSEQPIPFWGFLSFAIKINKVLLFKKLHEYINHFMLGELIPPPKVRYFSYQQQREWLSKSIQQIAKRYGNQNFSITLDELAKEGGWQRKNEKNFRFYETMFALEMIGQIEIRALRKEEIVASLTDKFDQSNDISQGKANKKVFNLEEEKAKITAIKFQSDFETAKAKWLDVKNILDAIHKNLPPLEDSDGIIEQIVNIENEPFTPEQKKIRPTVLKHAYNNGAISLPVSRSSAVISSEPVRKFMEGETILIEDLSKFENYKAKIDDLCNFIEKEGREKFADVSKQKDQPKIHFSSFTLTTADKKKLCVLEKIKEEYDLTPKTPVTTHIHFGYSYTRPAGEARLYGQKLSTWIQECNLGDRLGLENVLAIFQQERLISKFIYSEQDGNLKIQFSEDFTERYEKYKAEILDKTKESENIKAEPQQQDEKPYCIIEGKLGFLKFNKHGKAVKIGGANFQPFKLLQCLTEPFGKGKNIDTIFESIRENIKHKSRRGVLTTGIDRPQKVTLIEYVIKELQKDNKLQGKITFKWDNLKTRLWLEYNG